MAKKTIQIRIDEETYKFVNKLLKWSGLFKTKSEALRYILSMGITAAEKFSEVFEKVERHKAIERSTRKNSILLSGGLTYLHANRDRFS